MSKSDQKSDTNQNSNGKKCKFCGQIHKPRECPAYGQECHKCKKKNHWVNCCQTKKVHETSAAPSADFVIEEIGSNIEKKVTEACSILKLNNKKVKVKLDTGAEVNVMPVRVYEQIKSNDVKMKTTATKLFVYGGADIPIVGKIDVKCEFCNAEEQAEFFIVKTDSKTFLSL